MSGRHGSGQVRAWAPTALSAVVALVPAGALLAAVGAAGSGCLLHQADLAAAGAGVAAVGLAAERLQTRITRRRVRGERWEHRQEAQDRKAEIERLHQELADAHHTLTVLRSRIVTLTERAAVAGRPALTERAARQRLAREAAYGDAPTMQLRRITPGESAAAPVTPQAGLPANPLMPRPVAAPAVAAPAVAAPAVAAPAVAAPAVTVPAVTVPAVTASAEPVVTGRPTPAQTERRRPVVTLGRSDALPGTSGRCPVVAVGPVPAPAAAMGSVTGPLPIALVPLFPAPQLPALPDCPAESVTPPIPRPASAMLPPGPRDPVSGPLAILVDPGAGLPQPRPHAASSASTVEAMVYASMAEARADELAWTLEQPGDPDRSGRHLGLADWDERTLSGLVIAGASTVGDPQARIRRGRHGA